MPKRLLLLIAATAVSLCTCSPLHDLLHSEDVDTREKAAKAIVKAHHKGGIKRWPRNAEDVTALVVAENRPSKRASYLSTATGLLLDKVEPRVLYAGLLPFLDGARDRRHWAYVHFFKRYRDIRAAVGEEVQQHVVAALEHADSRWLVPSVAIVYEERISRATARLVELLLDGSAPALGNFTRTTQFIDGMNPSWHPPEIESLRKRDEDGLALGSSPTLHFRLWAALERLAPGWEERDAVPATLRPVLRAVARVVATEREIFQLKHQMKRNPICRLLSEIGSIGNTVYMAPHERSGSTAKMYRKMVLKAIRYLEQLFVVDPMDKAAADQLRARFLAVRGEHLAKRKEILDASPQWKELVEGVHLIGGTILDPAKDTLSSCAMPSAKLLERFARWVKDAHRAQLRRAMEKLR